MEGDDTSHLHKIPSPGLTSLIYWHVLIQMLIHDGAWRQLACLMMAYHSNEKITLLGAGLALSSSNSCYLQHWPTGYFC